jgi:MFS family permease
MIIWAPSWLWIVVANVFLGINQGLTWTMTQTSSLDLADDDERGLAASLNEWGGYLGVAVTAMVTGYLATVYGPRPIPFFFGFTVIAVALILSIVAVQETQPYANAATRSCTKARKLEFRTVFKRVSWRDRSTFACSQAGFIEKFVDVMVWVGFPLFFAALHVESIGLIVGVYGLSWGFLQLAVGPMSDRFGRKPLIVAGMWICGLGIALTPFGNDVPFWLFTSALTGTGMALLYPTLIAAVSDATPSAWRASALGVYRMWRDSGYAWGAILLGVVMDRQGLTSGFFLTAVLMFVSGFIVMVFLDETR